LTTLPGIPKARTSLNFKKHLQWYWHKAGQVSWVKVTTTHRFTFSL